MTEHRLVLADRCAGGERHIHRWTPSCSCGKWWGINARTRDKAAKQWRRHAVKKKSSGRGAHPHELTPEHLLPDALRRSVA